jgi:hypothetical protein
MSEPRALDAVQKAIIKHLEENLPGVDSVLDGFPNVNEELSFPAASIMMKDPILDLAMNEYTISKSEVEAPGDGETGEKSKILRVYGEYTIEMQVDLWAEYKPQLRTLMEEFSKLFNPSIGKTGISVQLENYHDEYVTYTLERFRIVEGEAEAQRNEWRAIATVSTGCRAIKEHLEYLMHTIENNIETPDEIESEDDPSYFGII